MRVLIAVKTYPNLSVKNDELVCTAGVSEDGSWVRLYPIPFRRMDYEKQYKKYQWIEIKARRRKEDPRPESFEPQIDTLQIGETVDTRDNWKKRKEYVLQNVYEDMAKLIDSAHENQLSIAVFKAKETIQFYHKEVSEDEHQKYREKMGKILESRKQMKLIDDGLVDVALVSKPDYRFYYKFEDKNGKESNMMIEDWEVQALYRNCFLKKDDKEQSINDVRKKYWDDFVFKKDLYFILGTTLEHHNRKSRNPFTIIGTFTPKKENN